MVEKDTEWAYKFCRDYDRKTKDPFDLYLEIKDREEIRRSKGLPPRVVLLPDWDKDDEQRSDEEQAKTPAATERSKAARKGKSSSDKPASRARIDVARPPERKA